MMMWSSGWQTLEGEPAYDRRRANSLMQWQWNKFECGQESALKVFVVPLHFWPYKYN